MNEVFATLESDPFILYVGKSFAPDVTQNTDIDEDADSNII